MEAFDLSWLLAAAALVLLAGAVGRMTGYRSFAAILIDERGRYSLSRFQLVVWTVLILANLLALFFSEPGATIPPELLGLIGISVGSATVAGAVKSNRDLSGAVVQKAGAFVVDPQTPGPTGAPLRLPPPRALAAVAPLAPSGAPVGTVSIPPHFAQLFLEEEGQLADEIINVTKFQSFVFTLALAVWYVAAVLTLAAPGYPELPENVVWLLGISHAGYIGGKVPKKE